MPVTLLLALLATDPDPDLLARLEAHAERLGELEHRDGDLSISVKTSELDSDGKVTHSKEMEMVVRTRDGHSSTELKKMLDDGADVTEAHRGDLEGTANKKPKREEKHQTMAEMSPFSKQSKGQYTFALLPPPEGRPGFVRIGFSPKGDKSPEVMIGDALVDAEKGEVVHLWLRPSKTPMFVDHLFFEADFDDPTTAGRGLSKLRVKGDGGFAFIHKRFDSVSTFHRDSVAKP